MSSGAFAPKRGQDGAHSQRDEGVRSVDRVNTGFSGSDTRLTPVTIAATSTRRSESWRVFC
jgi:hypothetical protein